MDNKMDGIVKPFDTLSFNIQNFSNAYKDLFDLKNAKTVKVLYKEEDGKIVELQIDNLAAMRKKFGITAAVSSDEQNLTPAVLLKKLNIKESNGYVTDISGNRLKARYSDASKNAEFAKITDVAKDSQKLSGKSLNDIYRYVDSKVQNVKNEIEKEIKNMNVSMDQSQWDFFPLLNTRSGLNGHTLGRWNSHNRWIEYSYQCRSNSALFYDNIPNWREFTVGGMFKFNHWGGIIFNFGDNVAECQLSGNRLQVAFGNSWYWINTNIRFSMHQWYHIVMSYNKSSGIFRIYINGEKRYEGRRTSNKVLGSPKRRVGIFARYDNSSRRGGSFSNENQVKKLRIFGRQFSDAEVKAYFTKEIL